MSDDFYVGYGPLPDRDRRFLLRAIPLGLASIAGIGAFTASRARSAGGGRWETGTPVTLTGRISFSPYPTLWVGEDAHVLAGIGKVGADPIARAFDGQTVQATGVRIVRGDCFMLGVKAGNLIVSDTPAPPIPTIEDLGMIEVLGEVLDAQCFMGIMNPGYGRTHRGCAAQCIRGGQPVYFSLNPARRSDPQTTENCGDLGFVLMGPSGEKANALVSGNIARPVIISARQTRQGRLKRLQLTDPMIRPV
ncbi:hypothetical protein ACFFUB_10950 [Algimonas porphyrae]|uniref:Uncharacterized protein n=1 Tax=Algimonas porphyrae TaxID=1128113 RepID=A0ABQ5V3W7_9PROT|nr:hypothetical protein [Algimonas porphyrae]GLQ21365.1 hypothetical protein GCM10007854_23200 [Algimonas porphyrae]